ncbi:MAG: hypothetical protein EBS28_00825 [Chlamydiae bacterium]|nr:hypothetical protein [Chlamydiota bacterium]
MLGAILNNRAPVNELSNSSFQREILQPLTRLERVWIVFKGLLSGNSLKFTCGIKYKIKNILINRQDTYDRVSDFLTQNKRLIRPKDIDAFNGKNWEFTYSPLSGFI